MTSFGKWLFVGLSPVLLAMRTAEAPVSRELAQRVATRFAEDWCVPLAQVRLAWGRGTTLGSPAAEAPFRIVGAGAGGWYVVVFDPSGSDAAAMRVRVGIERPQMVAARSLPGGTLLTAEDLREEVRIRWGVPSPDSTLVAAVGWEVRRPLRAGDALVPPAVAAPPLVVAGHPVRLEWRNGDVDVSVVGIALNSARRGELVRAKLEERPARLTGTVTAPGIALLTTGGRR